MKIIHAHEVAAANRSSKIQSLLGTITEQPLRAWVERIAVPRHFVTETQQNREVADWICDKFESMGLRVERQGNCVNIVAMPRYSFSEAVLVGAHYDSVPMSPGADDNASAVAAMLGCAEACSLWRPVVPVVFVAFNREEENLRGSRDFVEAYLPGASFRVVHAHILEMVGYASSTPGTQRVPTGLPIQIPETGDFLGLVANQGSQSVLDLILPWARAYTPQLPVTGLKVERGLEKLLPVLARSDHASFWGRNLPALMWTDTSEFRNPHYHSHQDTPDTLNYTFLKLVTQLLTACVIEASQPTKAQGELFSAHEDRKA